MLSVMVFSCSSASAERSPCFQAFRLFLGAPGLVPPCIRHRRLPLTTGERHSAPDRVFAPQRGALARFSGCMGLSVKSSNKPLPSLVQGYQKAAGLSFPYPFRNCRHKRHTATMLKSLGFSLPVPQRLQRCRHRTAMRLHPPHRKPLFYQSFPDLWRLLRLLRLFQEETGSVSMCHGTLRAYSLSGSSYPASGW